MITNFFFTFLKDYHHNIYNIVNTKKTKYPMSFVLNYSQFSLPWV